MAINLRMDAEAQLRQRLRQLASHYLPRRVEELCGRFKLRVHGVCVRDQKGRWGSCSETGGISLNWRLILLPPSLQDHVILHELAHMRHFDHSRGFYQFLQKLDPRADSHAAKLDTTFSHLIGLGRKRE